MNMEDELIMDDWTRVMRNCRSILSPELYGRVIFAQRSEDPQPETMVRALALEALKQLCLVE